VGRRRRVDDDDDGGGDAAAYDDDLPRNRAPAKPRPIPGLEKHYSDVPHRGGGDPDDAYDSRPHRGGVPGLAGIGQPGGGAPSPLVSPVKRMSALRDMTSGLDPSERSLRLKKEQEYQQQLREQIEEKARQKDAERRQLERAKERELREYLSSQYEGDIPPHLQHKVSGASAGGGGGGGYHSDSGMLVGGRGAKRDLFKQSHEQDTAPRRGGGGGGGGGGGLALDLPRRGGPPRDDADEWEDGPRARDRDRDRDRRDEPDDDDRYGNDDDADDDGRGRRGMRQLPPSGAGAKGAWVSKAEYDRLTKLCDRLLAQQDELTQEIQHQASLIQGLQKKGPAVAAAAAASGVGGLSRSRSVQDQRPAAKAKAGGKAPPPAPSAFGRRPASTHGDDARQARVAGAPQRPPLVPKAAFGAGGGGGGGGGVLGRAGRDAAGAGGRPGPQLALPPKVPVGRAGFGSGVGRSLSPTPKRKAGGNGGGGVGGGFAKLQHGVAGGKGSVVRGGPAIVTYNGADDSPVRGGGGGHKGVSVRFGGGSSERDQLRGESEYLRVTGEDVDVISGDQLDRLLVQARKARAAY